MQTLEIPRARWAETLQSFSLAHEGWLASVDVLSPDLGAQPEIRDLPLLAVSTDPDGDGTVTLSFGRSPGDHVTHVLRGATHLWIERTDRAVDAALLVETVDGTKTVLRLKHAVAPETVDGVVS